MIIASDGGQSAEIASACWNRFSEVLNEFHSKF